MFINSKNLFLIFYNQKVPNWKKIQPSHLSHDKSLDKIINSIEKFIIKNNLDPKKLVDAIIKFYYEKNKRYPNIFLFKGNIALSIYKNHKLPYKLDLNKMQKIAILVKKNKILVKNLTIHGIIYSEGVNILQTTGKADPYFLLAHGITKDISKQIVKEWEDNDEIKKLVLDAIFS